MKNFNSNFKLEETFKQSYSDLENVKNLEGLSRLEKKYLKGNESFLSFFLSNLKNLESELKSEVGLKINSWKNDLFNSIKEMKEKFRLSNEKKIQKNESSLKTRKINRIGNLHLIRKSISDIYDFFVSRGYSVFESSEIDTNWYNFDSLNLKDDHPARNWSDTFYFSKDSEFLLRTHTSNSQVRIMENNKNKELMTITAGKVYRNDDDDFTHSHQYTNLEIINIGKKVSFANLKWTLEDFFQWFFKRKIITRFRPSFFPFTEPSFEVDVSCVSCENIDSKCNVCRGTGWIEILGAGLINPIVLKNGGYDKNFCGFAVGVGVERILMIKYGINDIREFYLNDPRFLIQNGWK